MLERLIAYDKELFIFLNNLGSEPWDGFWLLVTDKWTSIPLYIVLLVLSFQKLGFKRTLVVIVSVVVMIIVTDQLANVFKYGVARLRPCHDETVMNSMRLVKAYCGGKFSYFSAHAANSFAVATFFAILFRPYVKWFSVVLVIWALMVAYSRIYIGVHFPMDIITGISVGLLIGWLFFILVQKINDKIIRTNKTS
ncbi:phosphatase PAP2 family protein [Leptobacterium sp. I13]|uniref:phosphatase PAP2 family protein n=1 Tax=Leptobacterium meishanense TaxID=3128904 RepID=UPI0030ED7597